MIYDTLCWKDDRGIIPWLAQSWDVSSDGRQYHFTLDPAARWQDGTPLTARDVAFSFDYYARNPYRWQSTEVVESARATDERTVTISLKRPSAAFLEEIAGVVPIIPAQVWEQVDDPARYDGAGATLGSGPYRVEEYRPAEGVYRLAANPAYFRGAPSAQEVIQLIVSQQVAPTTVLQD